MSRKRRKFSKEFKGKVVLESLKERETLESLAKKYELTPQQISTWKQQAMSNFSELFDKDNTQKEEKDYDKDKLYAEIGRLKIENDFLKKNLK